MLNFEILPLEIVELTLLDVLLDFSLDLSLLLASVFDELLHLASLVVVDFLDDFVQEGELQELALLQILGLGNVVGVF